MVQYSNTNLYKSKCNCIHDTQIGVTEDELRLIKVPNKQFRDPGAATDVDVDYYHIPMICEVNYGPLGREEQSPCSLSQLLADPLSGQWQPGRNYSRTQHRP